MTAWLLLLACAGGVTSDTAAETCADTAPEVTWDGDVHGFFLSYCDACHAATSPERHGAPTTVTFDTPQQVLAMAQRIRVRTLDEQTMPVGGGVPSDDLALLEAWLACPR